MVGLLSCCFSLSLVEIMERTPASQPILLVPGLFASPRFYEPQLASLWRFGPVMIADHTRDESMQAIARRILAAAPPRFALVGHSMGGYIAFEIMRQAPGRVAKLALLDTAARADTPEQSERRRSQIAIARSGRISAIIELQFPHLVHPSRRSDATLRRLAEAMAEDGGADAFIRQQNAIMNRPDSRPTLAAIRCPTLVLVGEQDELTPPERSREIAGGIAGARLVVVPDCGHMCALEQPERVTQELVLWLEGR
jgi:pimeloyl-ACP methyl ester carboxylesterase